MARPGTGNRLEVIGDATAFGAAILLALATALVACWLPARRATAIEATEALRAE